MSAAQRPEAPDVDVLTRVLEGLRSLPEQERRGHDDEASPATDAPPVVPLPRRR
ncbi:hypothetical protein [Actinomycetospora soli]|uniref:hypothetical protein n=1 Tax=Actinomycetospora soli TaxID=2893887 RepID=UPI001E3E1BDB|nr:hypothetical protein [Actinomycetospora soli]MCD2190166.1 hypothetical protein [Actinomycetospora soli]